MARRQSGSNMLLGAGVLAGAAYLLLSRRAQASMVSGNIQGGTVSFKPTPGGLVAPPAPVPGSFAPVGSQVTAAQAIWANLTPTTGPYSGYVNFPSGSQAAATFLPWAIDDSGNYYTQWAGQIYIVGVTAPDASGNYPSKLLGT
jgi:hypothetical protein